MANRKSKKEKLVFIKLGGSVITDKRKRYTAKRKMIGLLGGQIVKLQKKYNGKIILVHGSGSFGHFEAKKYNTAAGYSGKGSLKGAVRTSIAADKINDIVIDELEMSGLLVKSFSPDSFLYSRDNKLGGKFAYPIRKALEIGLVPVVFGDVVMDERCGFVIYSGERVIDCLLAALNEEFDVDKIVYVADVDGVLDFNGNVIEKISPYKRSGINGNIGGSSGVDVTGGMIKKVLDARKQARKYSCEVHIVNGKRKNVLVDVVLHGKSCGTLIAKDSC